MANGKLNLGKQSGGVLSLTFHDGATNTEVMLPESGELVNKDYADLKVALADFTGTNVKLANNGYQKLPSGLIIQWGDGSNGNLIFPISFTTTCFIVVTSDNDASSSVSSAYNLTKTSCTLANDGGAYWLAIGY